jgi:hypothetical protein
VFEHVKERRKYEKMSKDEMTWRREAVLDSHGDQEQNDVDIGRPDMLKTNAGGAESRLSRLWNEDAVTSFPINYIYDESDDITWEHNIPCTSPRIYISWGTQMPVKNTSTQGPGGTQA